MIAGHVEGDPDSFFGPDIWSPFRMPLHQCDIVKLNNPFGAPINPSRQYCAKVYISPRLVVMAQLQTEDAALSVVARPRHRGHAFGVLDGKQYLIVVAGVGHVVGLVGEGPVGQALGDRVRGIGDTKRQPLIVGVSVE